MKNSRWMVNCAVVISVLVALGCRPIDEDSSSVKYGFLPDQGTPILAFFPSGSTVRVCGSWTDDIKNSLKIWGDALGKSYTVIEDCEDPDVIGHNYQSEHAKKLCAQNNSTGVDRAYADLYSESLGFFQCAKEGYYKIDEMVLHEMGHLYGLCDLYEEAISLCESVNNIDKNSVMYRAASTKLEADDIKGIKALDADISKRRKDWTK